MLCFFLLKICKNCAEANRQPVIAVQRQTPVLFVKLYVKANFNYKFVQVFYIRMQKYATN